MGMVDNAVDEAMNGYASSIFVTLHKDGHSVTVSDDGRGIPIDVHPKCKRWALEIIFCTLHAGGKFDGSNYKASGGLHGVGGSVVNALSSELVATVKRDGAEWQMKFHQGKPSSKLTKMGSARGSGTTVLFRPDPTVFPKTEFSSDMIRERLEIASYIIAVSRSRSLTNHAAKRPSFATTKASSITCARLARRVRRGPRTKRHSRLRRTTAANWRPRCSGRRRPMKWLRATSTVFQPGRAARTKPGFARGLSRPCVIT